jgi:sugar lactone lactonase YvrE
MGGLTLYKFGMKTFLGGAMSAVLMAGFSASGAAQTGDILIGDGVRIHPESIAAIPGGGLLIGSVGRNGVYRWNPGDETATPWVTVDSVVPGGKVFGVFAEGNNAWVCSDGQTGTGLAILVRFDLTTAERTGTFPLPDHGRGGGACNDMAVNADGTLFVTETNRNGVGRVLALAPDASGNLRFVTVLSGTSLGGLDGLAFLGDTLYVNDVYTNKLYRLELDGTSLVSFSVLNVSAPLSGPDGMRATLDGTGLLLAEGGAMGNRVDLVTIDGDNANVEVLRDGMNQPTGVAQIGDTAYVVESRTRATVVNLNQVPFLPALTDPGEFRVVAIPLP